MRPAHLLTILLACLPAPAAGQSVPTNAADLRRALDPVVKQLAPPGGYRLSGRFHYQGAGDEISYRAEIARRGASWTVDFTSDDPARDLRFGASSTKAWAASREATTLAAREELPACARFDYPQLLGSLLDILERGSSDKQYLVSLTRNNFFIRGSLPGELTATFLFEGTAPFPRKVTLHEGRPPLSLWSFVATDRGRPRLLEFPESGKGHVELWFSDPETIDSAAYPRRTDFADASGVIATFILDEWQPLADAELSAGEAPKPVWESTWNSLPGGVSQRTALFLPAGDRAAFLRRLDAAPWSGWARMNAVLAWWCAAAPWIAWAFPVAPAPGSLAIGLAAAFLFALALLYRRRRRYGTGMRGTAVVVGAVLALLFVAGTASHQLSDPHTRSRMTLQCAVRFALTGQGFYARSAAHYLRTVQPEPVADGEPGRSCANYAAAYDLCRAGLAPEPRSEIERRLLDLARPLYGSLQGWRARSLDAPGIAVGLGLAGLATGCESCVDSARSALERSLTDLFRDGVHRAGPGPGAAVLARAADLAYALKSGNRHDLFADPRFSTPVRHTFSMLSPAGTLPLIGATNLEHSLDAQVLALKVAGRLPGQPAGIGAAAPGKSPGSVRRAAAGWMGWWRRLWSPVETFFDDPLVLFEATDNQDSVGSRRESGDCPLDGRSLVVGDRIAVLRSGPGPEDLYLSIGVLAPDPERPVHDVLGFDLFGRGAMLVHGSGYPAAGSRDLPAAGRSTGRNTITIGERSQGVARSAGITSFVINQPLFDFVQASADRSYENAQVRRDIVMVRPEEGHAGYVILVDDIQPLQQDVPVVWQLFSQGALSLGFAQNHQWVVKSFVPGSRDVMLSVFLPGNPGQARSAAGRLFSGDAGRSVPTNGLVVENTGRRRIVAVLAPRVARDPEPRVVPVGSGGAAQIQDSDWISLGNAGVRQTTGPLQHVSEFVVARERAGRFPALFMCSGTEFRTGPHSLSASRPVTLSTDGIRGTIVTTIPGTTIEIRTPVIPAPLVLKLENPGRHPFSLDN